MSSFFSSLASYLPTVNAESVTHAAEDVQEPAAQDDTIVKGRGEKGEKEVAAEEPVEAEEEDEEEPEDVSFCLTLCFIAVYYSVALVESETEGGAGRGWEESILNSLFLPSTGGSDVVNILY